MIWSTLNTRAKALLAIAVLSASVAACGGGSSGESSGSFLISVSASEHADAMILTEGDPDGLLLDIQIDRLEGFTGDIALSVTGQTDNDVHRVTSAFSTQTLSGNTSNSNLILRLSIDDLPIMPHNRDFSITARSGSNAVSAPLSIEIEPTSAPDIYLLAGQSNMEGFSGDGTRESDIGGADEPVDRIKQLNVSRNNDNEFLSQSDYTARSTNLVAPDIVVAMDPLHIPLESDSSSGKSDNEAYIGLGLSFAKSALNDTTADIILVPAAWSGSAFCANGDFPPGNWNGLPSDNPDLGNTWLFDRAVTRTNLAIEETGGVLRGILWHQGESDDSDSCAAIYTENLTILVEQLRLQINEDARGAEARQADSNIPFVLGTMSQGIDDRPSVFPFPPQRASIDEAHRLFPGVVPYTGLSNHDDLVPANGFPCGNSSCIHFGAEALREMGSRYYDALLSASANPLTASP